MSMPTYRLRRLGLIMSPDLTDPREFWGVFNPAVAKSPAGSWHLLARVTAEGNVSRLRSGEIELDGGVPTGVRRADVVLGPDEPWERGGGRGGVEDPRVTWVQQLGKYVLTYTAQAAHTARPALAVSDDLVHWRRLGPLLFTYDPGLAHDLNGFSNKDVVLFPEPVRAPDGSTAYAFLHRPMWDPNLGLPRGVTDPRHSIWVSYVGVDAVAADIRALVLLDQHRPVAEPRYPFEQVKIGAGTPPVRVPEGWLLLHHGVSEHDTGAEIPGLVYAAGAMILDADDVTRVRYRTAEPILAPETTEERAGVDRHIVFPSALADIDGVRYAFYGVADRHIGVARLESAEGGEPAGPQWRHGDEPAVAVARAVADVDGQSAAAA